MHAWGWPRARALRCRSATWRLRLAPAQQFSTSNRVPVPRQLTLLPLFETVELNEVGFKFVRKCINAVETKGKVPAAHPGVAALLACPRSRHPEACAIIHSIAVLANRQSCLTD